MEQIVKELENSNIPGLRLCAAHIHLLLYADDIVLLANNAIYLQEKINILKSFFDQNNLRINIEKTKVLIFRKSGKLKRKPKFFWGDEEIDITNKYHYLGVPFYDTLSNHNTPDYFFDKGKNSLNALFNVFYRCKLKTFNSHYKMFQSYVQSIILYCAPIWGLRNMERFDIYQSKFLRRLFQLPNCTPRWFLRLETNILPLEFTLIRATLRFWLNIMKNPESSIIRQSYESLVSDTRKRHHKYNWFSYFTNIINKWQVQNIINLEETNFISETQRRISVSQALGCIKTKMIEIDIGRMKETNRLNHYKEIHSHVKCENYLNYKLSWGAIRMVIQLRLNCSYITLKGKTAKLKATKLLYNPNDNDINCDVCNLNECESIFHIICKCPHYSTYRNLLCKELSLDNMTNENYYNVFYGLSINNCKLLYFTITKILEVRQQSLELISQAGS